MNAKLFINRILTGNCLLQETKSHVQTDALCRLYNCDWLSWSEGHSPHLAGGRIHYLKALSPNELNPANINIL